MWNARSNLNTEKDFQLLLMFCDVQFACSIHSDHIRSVEPGNCVSQDLGFALSFFNLNVHRICLVEEEWIGSCSKIPQSSRFQMSELSASTITKGVSTSTMIVLAPAHKEQVWGSIPAVPVRRSNAMPIAIRQAGDSKTDVRHGGSFVQPVQKLLAVIGVACHTPRSRCAQKSIKGLIAGSHLHA